MAARAHHGRGGGAGRARRGERARHRGRPAGPGQSRGDPHEGAGRGRLCRRGDGGPCQPDARGRVVAALAPHLAARRRARGQHPDHRQRPHGRRDALCRRRLRPPQRGGGDPGEAVARHRDPDAVGRHLPRQCADQRPAGQRGRRVGPYRRDPVRRQRLSHGNLRPRRDPGRHGRRFAAAERGHPLWRERRRRAGADRRAGAPGGRRARRALGRGRQCRPHVRAIRAGDPGSGDRRRRGRPAGFRDRGRAAPPGRRDPAGLRQRPRGECSGSGQGRRGDPASMARLPTAPSRRRRWPAPAASDGSCPAGARCRRRRGGAASPPPPGRPRRCGCARRPR